MGHTDPVNTGESAPIGKQRQAMERLIRLTVALRAAGKVGLSTAELLTIARFPDDAADPASQLARDFRHLRGLGWQIDNVAEVGEDGRYRMTNGDSRLRVQLTPPQQAALRRAALVADRDDLAEQLGLDAERAAGTVEARVTQASLAPELDVVGRAVQTRALLTFRYNGRERVVHPAGMHARNNRWYLAGQEVDGETVKMFVVSRMSQVRAGAPRSATAPAEVPRPRLHPMAWLIDDPVDVELVAAEEFVPDVRRWLGTPTSQRSTEDGEVRLVYTVTHRKALRTRLYELGTRVRVAGPPEFRDELLADLTTMAGL